MEITQNALEIGVLVVGALLGAFKGVSYYDMGKPLSVRLLDTCMGAYVGTTISYHYASELSIWYSGALALLAGASGAMVVEVLLKLLPAIVKDIVKVWLARVSGHK